MNADLLVVGAHPDDLELHFGGIAARAAMDGLIVVGLDLTRGERASRGTPEVRAREAEASARVLGLAERVNADLPDTAVTSTDRDHLVAVVTLIRRVRPRWVLAPHPEDPHPDHREGGRLLERALYFAHVGGFSAHGTGIVVDVSAAFARKKEALACYASQFAPGAGEATRLNRPGFLDAVEARARRLGELVGVTHGEGLVHAGALAWTAPLGGLFGEHGFAGGPTA